MWGESGPGALGEGKQQNLGGEGPYWAPARTERRGGARRGFVSEQPSPGNPDAGYAAVATAAEGRGAASQTPPRPPPGSAPWAQPPVMQRWVPKVLPGGAGRLKTALRGE